MENGLVVVAEHLESVSVAAYHLYVGAGSAHERPDEAGAAHFVEHMLFKGTEDRDSVEINDEIENLGGNVNAFTTYDHTVYHMVLPSRFWREGLEVLTDMVFHSRMDEEEFEIERSVILEEIREGDDSLENYLGDRFFEAFYQGHPYGRPVVSNAEAIRRLSLADLISFFGRWYRPGNMVLAVAGDVDWHALVDAVADLTGDSVSDPGRLPTLPAVNPDRLPVRTLLNRGSEERILEIAFPVPGVKHEDVPALELASVVLAGGEMSRLYRELRLRRELARSIQTNLFVPLETGAFVVHALPYAGREEKTLRELIRQIGLLKKRKIPAEELTRAKLTLEKEIVFSDETAEGRAKTLGYFQLTYGAFEQEESYRNRILSVTEAELRSAVNRHFDLARMSAALLLPRQETLPTSEEIAGWIKGERTDEIKSRK
jgi:zinc protease